MEEHAYILLVSSSAWQLSAPRSLADETGAGSDRLVKY